MERAPETPGPVRVAILIVVSVALVAATVSVWYAGQAPGPSSLGLTGPGITVTVNQSSLAAAGLSGSSVFGTASSVQVFAVEPSATTFVAANLSQVSPMGNAHELLLFNGTVGPDGIASGALSSQFYNVSHQWVEAQGPMSTSVSLQLVVTLNSVAGGVDQVYDYFDNLAYDPVAPPSAFSADVAVPHTPSFTVPVGGCDSGFFWHPVNESYLAGIDLPLAILDASGSPPNVVVTDGVTFFTRASIDLHFGGAVAFSGPDGTLSSLEASATPSWSGVSNGTHTMGILGAAATGADEVPIDAIGLAEVSLVVTNFAYDSESSACHIGSLGETGSLAEVVGVPGQSLQLRDLTLPRFFTSLMANQTGWSTFGTVPLKYAGQGFNFYSALSNASGYRVAIDAYRGFSGGSASLPANLGLAILTAVVSGAVPGGNVTIARASSALYSILGGAAPFASSLNAIGYSSNVSTGNLSTNVNQPGIGADVPLTTGLNADNTGTTILLPAAEFLPEMPLVYLVVT